MRLSTDYLEEVKKAKAQGCEDPETLGLAKTVVYTGPIDAYFDYSLGTLQYRRVEFEEEMLDVDNYQGNVQINNKFHPYINYLLADIK